MNQITSEKKHRIHAPVPLYSTPFYQQNSKNQCFVPLQGGPPDFLPRGTQNQPPVTCMQAWQASSNTFSFYGTMHNGMPRYYIGYLPVSADNMPACQMRNSSSSLPQDGAGASTHSSLKPVEDALQKRENRLRKNREAARLCRKKKKEYVSCLEYRVAVLEKQNRTLIEELQALGVNYLDKVA